MKKILIDFTLVIIAALLGLLVFTVFSIFIAAVVNDAENPFTQNLLISMICTASFVIGLIYVKKIRDGIGDDEFFDDYSNTSYISLKEDLPKVLANEKWTLILIGVIAILCYIINIVWFGVLGNTSSSFRFHQLPHNIPIHTPRPAVTYYGYQPSGGISC